MLDLLQIRINDFENHLNESFKINFKDNQYLTVKLIEIKKFSNFSEDKGKPFSLIFYSEENIVLPQQIYNLEHPVLGQVDLFLVTIGPNKQGMNYEAIFT